MNSFFKSILPLFLGVMALMMLKTAYAQDVGYTWGSETTVSAAVGVPEEIATPTPLPPGEKWFKLTGYTSPNALVTIQNPGIHNEIFANQDGYFVFKYLGLSTFHEDICLIAHDTENRTTPSTCIPPPSVADSKEIGPILLPPSTSISAGNAYVGDTVTLTGQTIPDVDVKLSLFTDEKKQNTLSFIPSVYAYTLPQFSLKSNKRGEYSLTLPTASSQFLRMFSRALYQGNSTPKGNTLILDIFPLWMILFRFFSTFFSILKAHLFEILILLQLYILLMYFLKHYFKPHIISKHRQNWLALRQTTLMTLPHELVREDNRLSIRSVALITANVNNK
jgi:hypothetical protein